jgi:hypothetical protein
MNWHTFIFSTLWAHYTSLKMNIGLTPFHLVCGLEVVLCIECEIPSLKLVVELLPNTTTKEEHLFHLTRLDETRHDATLANKTHKKCFKS